MAILKSCFLGLLLLIFESDFVNGEKLQTTETGVIDLQDLLKKVDNSLQKVSDDRYQQLRQEMDQLKKTFVDIEKELLELRVFVAEARGKFRSDSTEMKSTIGEMKADAADLKISNEIRARYFLKMLLEMKKDFAETKMQICKENGLFGNEKLDKLKCSVQELKTTAHEDRKLVQKEFAKLKNSTTEIVEEMSEEISQIKNAIETRNNDAQERLSEMKSATADIEKKIYRNQKFMAENLATFNRSISKKIETTTNKLAEITSSISETNNNGKRQENIINKINRELNEVRNTVIENSKTIQNLTLNKVPSDCWELYQKGARKDGVYQISLEGSFDLIFSVYCDMTTDGGGWTVFQRRGQFGNAEDYFYRSWKEYKEGFGDLNKEFWLGNDKIHLLTKNKRYDLRVDLINKDNNTAYAQYQSFVVENEQDFYRLTLGYYSGTAGDSMGLHNGMYFTTKDMDKDIYEEVNCAILHKGAWWYRNCLQSNLNGFHTNDKRSISDEGMIWWHWKSSNWNLQGSAMKVRPTERT